MAATAGTRTIRTVIVDDEPLARQRLRSLLARETDVQVIAECEDGQQAVATIRDELPDLVFLDIRMPDMDGFEVLEHVDGEAEPAVVFVTAYEEYAVRAFDVRGIDYLLKPFDRERLTRALERVRRHLADRSVAELPSQLRDLLAEMGGRKDRNDRFIVRSAGKVVFIKADDTDWIEAEGNYVRLHVGEASHLMRETMSHLEDRLDGEKFVRIHRSTIVNMERVKEMQPWFNGEYVVVLRDATRLIMSRGYRQRLAHLFGEAK